MKAKILYILNNFEAYIAALSFGIVMVLLSIQVVSRYVFSKSITWTEELATVLYVLMIYCAISASVTKRKHLRIELIYDLVSYKARKAIMILGDIIFLFFCIYVQFPLWKWVNTLGFGETSLLRIPKSLVYGCIPVFLLLTAVRIVQNIIRTIKENEETLGASEPAVDLDKCEQEYLASVRNEKET